MNGKAVLIVGGGSGIGRAAALRLSGEGAIIGIADCNVEAAQSVKDEIAGNGGRADAFEVEISDRESVQRVVDTFTRNAGRLDVLVNSAGIAPASAVVDMDPAEWERVIAVNLNGAFYVSQAAARVMCDRGSGTIILIASDSGVYGQAWRTHYSASKAGVIAFVRGLAKEVGRRGVTVNAINPGTTDTPLVRKNMTPELRAQVEAEDPLGKLSQPEDIAEIILFLAQTAGRFMTGQLITTRIRYT
jgi:NAD(P)-dependent dehydrogenase (short-subunit alcohol dehydrogenase family)